MWIFVTQNLVVLDKIDLFHTEPLQRFVELSRGLFPRPAVNLRHEKCFFPITIAERFTHANLAGAFVVVPAVIQKVDTPVYGRAHNSDRKGLINMLQTKVQTSN